MSSITAAAARPTLPPLRMSEDRAIASALRIQGGLKAAFKSMQEMNADAGRALDDAQSLNQRMDQLLSRMKKSGINVPGEDGGNGGEGSSEKVLSPKAKPASSVFRTKNPKKDTKDNGSNESQRKKKLKRLAGLALAPGTFDTPSGEGAASKDTVKAIQQGAVQPQEPATVKLQQLRSEQPPQSAIEQPPQYIIEEAQQSTYGNQQQPTYGNQRQSAASPQAPAVEKPTTEDPPGEQTGTPTRIIAEARLEAKPFLSLRPIHHESRADTPNEYQVRTVTDLGVTLDGLTPKRKRVQALRRALQYLARQPQCPLPRRMDMRDTHVREVRAAWRKTNLPLEDRPRERIFDDQMLYLIVSSLESRNQPTEKVFNQVDTVLDGLDPLAKRYFMRRVKETTQGDAVVYHGGVRMIVTDRRVTLLISHRVEGSWNKSVVQWVDVAGIHGQKKTQ